MLNKPPRLPCIRHAVNEKGDMLGFGPDSTRPVPMQPDQDLLCLMQAHRLGVSGKPQNPPS